MVATEELPAISRRVRALRIAAGLKQQELATRAGLSISIVTQLEQGRSSNPRLDTLEKLAEALGVKVVDLLSPE